MSIQVYSMNLSTRLGSITVWTDTHVLRVLFKAEQEGMGKPASLYQPCGHVRLTTKIQRKISDHSAHRLHFQYRKETRIDRRFSILNRPGLSIIY
uniref:Transposase DDE domain-containing protein n=1 Tax=Pandoraea norimbergensis TaxID=93219 RepID=A0ABM6BFM6_9BURK